MSDIIYHAGHSTDCVYLDAGAAPRSTDVGGDLTVNAGFAVRAYLKDPTTNIATPVSSGTVWMGYTGYSGTYNVNQISFRCHNSSDVMVVRIIVTGNNAANAHYLNSSGTWVSFGTVPYSNTHSIDVKITLGELGEIKVYLGGSLSASVDLNTSHFGNIAYMGVGSLAAGNSNIRRLLIANFSTIDHVTTSVIPTSNGAHTGWTGSYTDIDETVADEADILYTNTVGARSSFILGGTAPTVASGRVIKGVAISARTRITDGSAVENITGFIKTPSSFSERPLTIWGDKMTLQGTQIIWTTDPRTSAPWTAESIPTIEYGFKAE